MQEGLHAFAALLAGADVGYRLDGVRDQGGRDVAACHIGHQAFAGPHRVWAGADQGAHPLIDGGIERIGTDDFMDEADAVCLCR